MVYGVSPRDEATRLGADIERIILREVSSAAKSKVDLRSAWHGSGAFRCNTYRRCGLAVRGFATTRVMVLLVADRVPKFA